MPVLVSVIIPAFNRADCVGHAIASVQAQTYPHWELIVADDGSTDGTAAQVEEHARRDSRVRLVRRTHNGGAQAARNAAINAARGEWVAFLDSDDTWLPDSLTCRLDAALARGVSVVHSGGDKRNEKGELTRCPVPPLRGRVYPALLLNEGPMFPAMMVRRDALQAIGGLDEQIVAFQEWDTALSLANRFDFEFVPASTFVWDCRRTDSLSKNLRRSGQGYEQVFHKRLWDILRICGPGAIAQHYRQAGRLYAAANSKAAARRCAAMAWIWSTLDVRGAVQRLRARLSPRM